MKIPIKEITVANRFIYYYANFKERFYGYVLRRDGRNIPDEHYAGRFKESGVSTRSHPDKVSSRPITRRRWRELRPPLPPEGREILAETEPGEVVLFLYRKRMMLGTFSHRVWGTRICIAAEDGRRLIIRRNSLVYPTGVGVMDNPDFLRSYGASVRALARHIDLGEIWNVFKDDQPVIEISDIGALYWGDDPDPSRWLALFIHLESDCAYFVRTRLYTYRPLETHEVRNRIDLLAGKETLTHELQEFLHWLGEDEEAYDPKTLTGRQRNWLEQIRQYALWGSESESAGNARKMLRKISFVKGDLQRHAFELMVRKRIWRPDENLDLLRSDLSPDFPSDVLKEAEAVDLSRILRGRRRLRRASFCLQTGSADDPELAFSLRRRWRGGYELGIHVPDIAACVPAGSALDRSASDRLATLRLPDLTIPMLPERIADDVGRFDVKQRRPALSLFWKLDRNLNFGNLRIVLTSMRIRTRLSADEVENIDAGERRPLAGRLRILSRLTDSLREQRLRRGAFEDFGRTRVEAGSGATLISQTDPADPANRIHHELGLLAATELGKWCVRHDVPAIYIAQDGIENRRELNEISHPIVRRHEIRRQCPYPKFSAEPALHYGYGIRACCAAVAPGDSYPDLMVQRQIVHHLNTGGPLYTVDELNLVRYRAQEEHAHHVSLRSRHERRLILNRLAASEDRTLSAVVLHPRRDGALVELTEYPVKTLVQAPRPVNPGDVLQLRVNGIDRWRCDPHFLVLQA